MKKWLVLLIFIFLAVAYKPSFCQGTINKSITVTASVPDKIPPTIPVLIAPENGSYLNNPTPTFIFKKSTDAQSPVRHYEMYLNKALFIKEIPSSQTPVQTAMFLSVITDTTVSVSLKQPLADGIYNWKIRAYDVYGNFVDSATWTFTIDTQAPFIIITQIEENTHLNLSSQDLNSIPAGLQLETFSQQPTIKGRSEPGAKIQLSLTLTPGFELRLTATTNEKGIFSLTPKQKLNPRLYTVLAIAADAAGNSTVLPEFKLLIKQALPSPLFPPALMQKPQALLQLPQATPSPAYLTKLPLLTLLFLLLWLIAAKIAFGFTWSILPLFLKLIIVPPIFFKKKRCLSFNQLNKKAVSFVFIKVNSQKILSNKKGLFSLKLKKGAFILLASRAGFFNTQDKIINQLASKLYLCLPLVPNPKNKQKYQFIYYLACLFLILALVFSLISLIFLPNIINLILMLFCLDLLFGFLV